MVCLGVILNIDYNRILVWVDYGNNNKKGSLRTKINIKLIKNLIYIHN